MTKRKTRNRWRHATCFVANVQNSANPICNDVAKCGGHMTSTQSRMMFAGIILFFISLIASAQTQSEAQFSPANLVQAVVRTELNNSDVTDVRWKYTLDKQLDGKQETREVIETKFGSLDRLISVANAPLSDAQQRSETERILRLSHNPAEQQKLEQSRRKDAAQCSRFLQMIPDAFVFEYAGENNGLVKLAFKPNPRFQPPSREGRILHEMAGEIWVNAEQQRLVGIVGHLMNEVRFGGGLLGHLEKGGQFMIKNTEVIPGHWELTEMSVNMRGKALLFKTISVQQKELHRNFERVPDDLSLSDAAGLLLNHAFIAAKR